MLGILAVTSEWGQRTGLTTFALVPERGRVVAAKILAATGLAIYAVTRLPAHRRDRQPVRRRQLGPAAVALARGALFELINVLIGVAFGLVFMQSALAIVLYFILPMAWAILGESIGALDKPADWLDTTPHVRPPRRRRHDRHRLGPSGHLGGALARRLPGRRTLAPAPHRAEVESAPRF